MTSDAADDRERGRQQHRLTPGCRRRGAQQMRKCLAQRQRADQDAERETAPLAKPAGGDLHAGRIDARERRSGEKTQRDHAGGGGHASTAAFAAAPASAPHRTERAR